MGCWMVIRDDHGEFVMDRSVLFRCYIDVDVGEAMNFYEALY